MPLPKNADADAHEPVDNLAGNVHVDVTCADGQIDESYDIDYDGDDDDSDDGHQ